MKDITFLRWCQVATGMIRYRPERKLVTRELRQHLDDRYESLLAQGLYSEDAEAKTLAAMGSSEELAPLLSEIHKPHWGYAWMAVKWAMIILIIVSLIATQNASGGTMFQTSSEWLNSTAVGNYQRIFYDKPVTTFSCDDYTLQIQKVALWTPISPEFGGDKALYLQIRVTQPPLSPKFNAWHYIAATDSSGTIYLPRNDSSSVGQYSKVSFGGVKYSVFSDTGILVLHNMDGSDMEWIDLHYNRDGRDITVRIDLTGGDSP